MDLCQLGHTRRAALPDDDADNVGLKAHCGIGRGVQPVQEKLQHCPQPEGGKVQLLDTRVEGGQGYLLGLAYLLGRGRGYGRKVTLATWTVIGILLLRSTEIEMPIVNAGPILALVAG